LLIHLLFTLSLKTAKRNGRIRSTKKPYGSTPDTIPDPEWKYRKIEHKKIPLLPVRDSFPDLLHTD